MSVGLDWRSERAWALTAACEARDDTRATPARIWWWAGVPFAVLAVLPILYRAAPDLYRDHVLPEGHGLLELSHFLIPLAGFLLGLRLLFATSVRRNRLWWTLIAFGTLACFYTAGEEHSWGQHFFGWQTPEAWGSLNRQNETNIHNVSWVFNVLPRAVLELTILLLGLVVPLAAWCGRSMTIRGLEPFMPSLRLVPVSIGALVYKLDGMTQKTLDVEGLVVRPAEAAETFYVLFMLNYLILIAQRIFAAERRRDRSPRLRPAR